MNKVIKTALASLMMFSVSACSKPQSAAADFEWTREGTYQTADAKELLMVYKSETEGYEGWSVGYYTETEQHGWIIQQEGNTLHGSLTAPGTGEDYIVTVKEEGEDGLLLITPDKKEHHFTPMVMPEIIGTLTVNTEGFGNIAVGQGDEEAVFDDEQPFQSHFSNIAEPTTFHLAARPDEGYRFVKWTLNGEDYSTEDKITVECSENMDFVAVFDIIEEAE